MLCAVGVCDIGHQLRNEFWPLVHWDLCTSNTSHTLRGRTRPVSFCAQSLQNLYAGTHTKRQKISILILLEYILPTSIPLTSVSEFSIIQKSRKRHIQYRPPVGKTASLNTNSSTINTAPEARNETNYLLLPNGISKARYLTSVFNTRWESSKGIGTDKEWSHNWPWVNHYHDQLILSMNSLRITSPLKRQTVNCSWHERRTKSSCQIFRPALLTRSGHLVSCFVANNNEIPILPPYTVYHQPCPLPTALPNNSSDWF